MAETKGRWLPHTTNHDFFEENYVYSIDVVEFWNTLTSLLVVYAGAVSLAYGRGAFFRKSVPLPLAFWFLGSLPFIIGLGSGAFHGTMQKWGQILDELPMVWSALIFHWMLLDVSGKPVMRSLEKSPNARTLTHTFFCVALVLGTAVYFAFDFAIFIALYALFIAWLAIRVAKLVRESEKRTRKAGGESSPQRRIALQAVTTYISGFLFLWLPTEVFAAKMKLQCADGVPRAAADAETLMSFWCRLRIEKYAIMQFTHAVFHLTSAMGTIAIVQFCAWQHFQTAGVPVRVQRASIALLGMDMVLPEPERPKREAAAQGGRRSSSKAKSRSPRRRKSSVSSQLSSAPAPLDREALKGAGGQEFKTTCWECRRGAFAQSKNSAKRCRLVLGHTGVDWREALGE